MTSRTTHDATYCLGAADLGACGHLDTGVGRSIQHPPLVADAPSASEAELGVRATGAVALIPITVSGRPLGAGVAGDCVPPEDLIVPRAVAVGGVSVERRHEDRPRGAVDALPRLVVPHLALVGAVAHLLALEDGGACWAGAAHVGVLVESEGSLASTVVGVQDGALGTGAAVVDRLLTGCVYCCRCRANVADASLVVTPDVVSLRAIVAGLGRLVPQLIVRTRQRRAVLVDTLEVVVRVGTARVVRSCVLAARIRRLATPG